MPDGANVLRGTVVVAAFLGVSIHYVVRAAGGEELTVFAQNLDGAEPESLGPGREVQLAWDPQHTFVVRQGERMTDPRFERALEDYLEAQRLSRRRFLGRAGQRRARRHRALDAARRVRRRGGPAGEVRARTPPRRRKSVSHPKTEIGDWTFSNWPLYMDKKVLKAFDKEYGGKVRYLEDINDNYEFFGKVRQQLEQGEPIGRDIVVLTDYMAARWVRNG